MVALKPGVAASEEIAEKDFDPFCDHIGKIAKAGKVRLIPDMPKTRPVKIVRSAPGAISSSGDVANVIQSSR